MKWADSEVFSHAHESPPVMIVPLLVLAAGAVFSGVLAVNLFVGGRREDSGAGRTGPLIRQQVVGRDEDRERVRIGARETEAQ